MRWGAKLTDTTKLSYKGRTLFLDKVENLLYTLQQLQQRAIACADHDDIAALAVVIPLPRPSESEIESLGGGAPDGAAPSLESTSTGNDTAWVVHQAEDQCSSEYHWLTLEGTWFEDLDTLPEAADSNQHLNGVIGNEGHPALSISCERGGNSHHECNKDCTSHGQTRAPNSPASNQRSRGDEQPNGDNTRPYDPADEQPVLFAPWAETFPAKLERFLDDLEDAPTTTTAALGIAGNPVQGGSTAPKLAALLVRLQRDIDDVARHRTSLSLTIRDARQSLQCNQSRWHRGVRADANDPALVMKSRGLGSPLIESATVNGDGDVDVDGWDSLPDAAPRGRLICRGQAAQEGRGGRSTGPGADAKSHAFMRVCW
ncbi:LipA and NB-ARC domain protein [Purpureocillium lavendulum]|uniref:LipA and NB-ARC domain protein n=1 Tax=Purpureocillium lavendulum TaxID=1247861 RepID=A0AB34FQ92_9HYPO|nr:LipA and NB-ARC domain protein [Purpureocillium lavendulum]